MTWNQDSILTAFEKLSNEGWNMKEPLKWGFTFYAISENELHNVFSELQEFNYQIEELKERPDLNLWQLYVSKTEALQPEKLHRRNLAFQELAESLQIDSYDGWDVQKIK